MLRDNVVDRQKTVGGVTYSYDMTRGKWLSIGTCHIPYGINHRNIKASRWLAVTQGIYSNNIGFKIPRKGTIVTAIIQAKNQATCKFIIKDENLLNVLSLELNNEADKVIESNTNFEEGISLRCYLEIVDGKIDFPFVVLECASRI